MTPAPDRTVPVPPEVPAALLPVLSSRILFEIPRFTGDTAALHRLPLLFWLMETARPERVLGLGLRAGAAYFALCQAIERLGLPARARGFGDWRGAEAQPARPGSVPEALLAHNARHYAGFSHLAALADPVEAFGRVGAEIFDLILLDGEGLPRDPAPLARMLTRHASPRAVLVILGTGDAGEKTPAPGRALLAALAQGTPALRFEDQDGCAVVLPGEAPDPRLAALAALPPNSPALRDLRGMLARLGQDLVDDRNRRPDAAGRPETAGEAGTEARTLQGVRHEALETAVLRAEIGQGQALRLREAQVLTAELERLTAQMHRLRLDSEAARARAGEQAVEAARAETRTALDDLATLRSRHFDEIADLKSDIAWLTGDLEAAQAALTEAHRAGLARQQAEAGAGTAADTDRRIAALTEAHRAELARQADLAATRLKAALSARQRVVTGLEVKLRLCRWQATWLGTARSRFGRKTGPSGGPLAAEQAAVARHPLFDAAWYLSAHPDLQGSRMDPAGHFLRHGLFEGRNPGPRFCTLDWFTAHPEALDNRRNPLLDPNLEPNRG
ncbi:MAG: hypothetical protein ACK4GW_10630 [Pseudorhodobacter sp.]